MKLGKLLALAFLFLAFSVQPVKSQEVFGPTCEVSATVCPTNTPYNPPPPTSPPRQGAPPVSGSFETTLFLLGIGAFSVISGITTFFYSSKLSKK